MAETPETPKGVDFKVIMKLKEKIQKALRSSLGIPDQWLLDYFGGATSSGINVSENLAMNLSSVWACVQVLSQTIGSLPIITYRRAAGGKERASEHRLYNFLRYNPNRDMTAYSWKSAMMVNLGFCGNHYSEIERDSMGRPVALWPMEASRTRPMRAKNGAIIYEYNKASGGRVLLDSYDVFHVKGLSTNGLVGLSQIAAARDVYGVAIAQQTSASKFFANGGQISGVLESDANLTDPAYKRIKESWEASHTGVQNAHKAAILDNGLKFKAISINPEEQQLLESRKFSVEEIARLYRMPMHKIQNLDKATFSNIEQQSIEFVTDTIRPWLVNIEEEIQSKLVMPSEQEEVYCEFLIDALLRGDIKARSEAYQMAINNGWMTANEIRERENMNRLPGDTGNKFFMPLNIAEIGAPRKEVKQ